MADLIDTMMQLGLGLLAITILLSFARLLRGPTLPDRVVALDMLTSVGIAITAVYAILTDNAVFLDVATILALISFLGTIAFARYIDLRR